MLVKTLIKKLEKLNGNLPVVVDGYESGVGDLKHIKQVKMVRNVNTAWYYGKHEVYGKYNKVPGKQVKAIRLH